MGDKVNKLILSGIGLLLSVLLVSASTYAWFAISTNPEVTGITVSIADATGFLPFQFSLNGESSWTTTLDLSSGMDADNVLRPISTYDGVNWFIPTYNAIGAVSGFSHIPESMVEGYCNTNDSDTNYFVYQDIYVRTVSTEANSFSVRLSNPLATSDLQDEENYGTYVLSNPQKDSDGNIVLDDAMTVLRIGFQVYDDVVTVDEDGNETTTYVKESTFYIYEPNADARSDDLTDMLGDTVNDQVQYIYEEGETTSTAEKYSDNYSDGAVYDTQVPIEADNVNGFVLKTVGDDTDTVLIQQKESSWDTDALKDASTYDSTYIETIGDFIGDVPEMTTITIGEVKMIRIYFWLEGQDIDCWNQIVEGNLFANLEFTGTAVEEVEEEIEEE